MHLGMNHSIPCLYPLENKSTPQLEESKMSPDSVKCLPEANLPLVENDCPGRTVQDSAILISSPSDSDKQADNYG